MTFEVSGSLAQYVPKMTKIFAPKSMSSGGGSRPERDIAGAYDLYICTTAPQMLLVLSTCLHNRHVRVKAT